MSVGELEQLLKLRRNRPCPSSWPACARTPSDTRRAGKMIYYRLGYSEVRQVIELLYQPLAASTPGRCPQGCVPEGLEWRAGRR